MTDYSTLKPIVLFRKHGIDTLEIARRKGVSEAEVYNAMRPDDLLKTKVKAKKSSEWKKTKVRNAEIRAHTRIKYAGHPG
jgi:hypothetical protein